MQHHPQPWLGHPSHHGPISTHPTHITNSAAAAAAPRMPSHMTAEKPPWTLVVRQQPRHAKVAGVKDKDKKPVDPPPILALVINDPISSLHIQSPYLFVSAVLEDVEAEKSGVAAAGGGGGGTERKSPHQSTQGPPTQNALTGSTVSSLHKLKDIDNVETAFFVFGDLAVKKEGLFRIRFDLLQIDLMSREVTHLTSVLSDAFEVQSARAFKGLSESTFLTRSLSDQGVRLRVRKTPKQKAVSDQQQRSHEELARSLKCMRHHPHSHPHHRDPAEEDHHLARSHRGSISSSSQGQASFYDTTNPYQQQQAAAYGDERPPHRRRLGSASISPSSASLPPSAATIMGYAPATPSSLHHSPYSQPSVSSSGGPMLPNLMAPLRHHQQQQPQGTQFGASMQFAPSPTTQNPSMETYHFTGGQQPAPYSDDASSGYAHSVSSQAQVPTNTTPISSSSGGGHGHMQHSAHNSIAVTTPENPVGAYQMPQYPSHTTASFPNGGLPAYANSAAPHSSSSHSVVPTSFSPDGYSIFETPYEYHQMSDHGLRTPQSPSMPPDAMAGFGNMNNLSYFSHLQGHAGLEPKHSA